MSISGKRQRFCYSSENYFWHGRLLEPYAVPEIVSSLFMDGVIFQSKNTVFDTDFSDIPYGRSAINIS